MKFKTLALMVVGAAAAAVLSPANGAFAGPHSHDYSGSQYCITHVGDNWSLVGGASCNATPDHANANSRWTDSFIVDFEARSLTRVTGELSPTIDSSSDAAFLTSLNASLANPGWMYVGNITGKGEHVYLLVKCVSGARTPWDLQGTCV